MLSEEVDRPRGILTKADREFLLGERTYDSEQTKQNTRARIRQRLQNAILDLKLLNHTLHDRDLDLVFGVNEEEVAETRIASTDAFSLLFRGLLRADNDMTRNIRVSDGIERAVFQEGRIARVGVDIQIEDISSEDILKRLESEGFAGLNSYYEFEKIMQDPEVDPQRLSNILTKFSEEDEVLLPEELQKERQMYSEMEKRRYEP